jgi:hypothetical protein
MSGLVRSGTEVKNITVTTNKEKQEIYREQQRQQQQQQREAERTTVTPKPRATPPTPKTDAMGISETPYGDTPKPKTTPAPTQQPNYWSGAVEGMERAAQKQDQPEVSPKPPQTINVTIAGQKRRLTYEEPKPQAPVGPTGTLKENMVSGMGPAPTSVTEALRGFRDTIIGGVQPEPFRRAEESMSRVQDRGTSSLLTPSRQARATLDIPIGVIKGGESLVNPNVRTAMGSVVGTGLQGLRGAPFNPFLKTVNEPVLLQQYSKDIEGREGELFGEIVFDVGLSKAAGAAYQKVSKVRVGSKTDEFLLQYSGKYKASAENVLKGRPNIVGSPTFDVGETDYFWSPARQKAIDTAFALELTPGSSGVTVPALVETTTKTKIVPSIWIRGGQVLGITDYRNYGFNKLDDSLQNAPQQLGIQTTLTRESRRGLPYIPTRLAPSVIKTPLATSLFGSLLRGAIIPETPTQTQKKTTPQKPVGPTLTTEPEFVESERKMPYTPEPMEQLTEQQKDLPVPRVPTLVSVPKPEFVELPKNVPLPKLEETPIQEQPEIVIPDTTQLPIPIQGTRQVLDTPPQQTRPTPPPTKILTTNTPTYPMFPQLRLGPNARSRKMSELFGRYRLKSHKVATIKELTQLGAPKKKGKKGTKNAVEKVLF